MKKMSVEWHQDCLENSLRYEDELRERIEGMKEQLDRIHESNNFKKRQIALAKLKGVTEFDGDKFGVLKKEQGK